MLKQNLLIVFAIAFGIGASVLHFGYLSSQSEKLKPKTIGYSKLKKDYDAGSRLGDPIVDKPWDIVLETHVPKDIEFNGIPTANLGNFLGARLRRDVKEGQMLLLDDIESPLPKPQLKNGERLLLVSLRDVAVERGLLRVGEEIGFVLPVLPAVGDESSSTVESNWEVVGPFRIASIGTQVQEGVLGETDIVGVVVKPETDGRLTGGARSLLTAIDQRLVRSVILYPHSSDK